MAWSRWVLPEAGVAVDEQRVVGPGRGFGHRLGGGVGEAVGRGDDEGVEGVAGIEDRRTRAGRSTRSHLVGWPTRPTGRTTGAAGGPSSRHGRSRARPQALLLGRLVDRGHHLELDGQVPADRSGHGVLDEPEEPGLDPVPDQGVGHPEHDLAVLDGQRGDPGQIGLPDGVGDLLAQGLRTQISTSLRCRSRGPPPLDSRFGPQRLSTAVDEHRSCVRTARNGRGPGATASLTPCVVRRGKRRAGSACSSAQKPLAVFGTVHRAQPACLPGID